MVASDCFSVIRTRVEKWFVTRPLPLAGALSWVTQKCARRPSGHLAWTPGTVGGTITEPFLPWRLQFRHYTLSPTFRCGGWYWGDEQGYGDSVRHPHRGSIAPPQPFAHQVRLASRVGPVPSHEPGLAGSTEHSSGIGTSEARAWKPSLFARSLECSLSDRPTSKAGCQSPTQRSQAILLADGPAQQPGNAPSWTSSPVDT